jgi:hypothetical protein
MKKSLVSALAALAMVVGGVAPAAHAANATAAPAFAANAADAQVMISTNCMQASSTTIPASSLSIAVNGAAAYTPNAAASISTGGQIQVALNANADFGDSIVVTYVGTNLACSGGSTVLAQGTSVTFNVAAALSGVTGFNVTSSANGSFTWAWTAVAGAGEYRLAISTSPLGGWISVANISTTTYTRTGYNPTVAWYVKVQTCGSPNPTSCSGSFISTDGYLANGSGVNPVYTTPSQVVVVTPVAPVVPVFKQPKFAMPSKIDVDATGKVSLSGKDMGVSTVLIGGKEQKIDTNSDEKLVFDTTGLAKGVHDLVMKGAFGTYTIQKAIQVGEAVVTKVAAVSARQVGMAGGELSISGQGLEGTTQITMNGQVLEIVSRTDSKVTFKVPASTVASVNSIMIEGSFVPVIFKNAFSYTK